MYYTTKHESIFSGKLIFPTYFRKILKVQKHTQGSTFNARKRGKVVKGERKKTNKELVLHSCFLNNTNKYIDIQQYPRRETLNPCNVKKSIVEQGIWEQVN